MPINSLRLPLQNLDPIAERVTDEDAVVAFDSSVLNDLMPFFAAACHNDR